MENQEKSRGDYFFTIDVFHITKTLIKRLWLIAACGLLAAAIGFFVATIAVTPTYSSYIKMYVKNSSYTTSESISSAEISAAKSLVKTYGEILNSRTTLEKVIEKADVKYTWKKLSSMITYDAVNNTETMQITVTSADPYEASEIANAIAEVLPVRVAEIVDGSSMKLIDSAVPNLAKVGPNVARYTAVGLAIGLAIAAAAVVVLALLDNRIHDEEYVIRTYNYPILGKIPDLQDVSGKTSGGYTQKRRSAGGHEGASGNGLI